jgi:ketosteroid isomerase-like protein
MDQVVRDRIDIEETFLRYLDCVDQDAPLTELREVFTEDATLTSDLVGSFTGQEGLRRFVARKDDAVAGGRCTHYVTNIRISVDGDTAVLRSHFIERIVGGERPREIYGRYECHLRRAAGRWLIAVRHVTIDS